MDLGFVYERVRQIAGEVAQKRGFEFVKSEIAGTKRSPLVRIFIDKPEGLSVEDCADVSRDIESILDAEDLIPSKYVLEVSSPGLERELLSADDFRRFSGKLAKVTTSSETDGSKTTIGRIGSVSDDGKITLNLRDGEELTFQFGKVEKANLKIDLEEEFRKR
jgi:ribosome maturation factor RimP